MTTQAERIQSIHTTRAWLVKLLTAKGVPAWIRKEAKMLLRHYPMKLEFELFVYPREKPVHLNDLA